ncbi:hypothetical protein N7510_010628 [Penicillium lagena]|uniref:uncharacterized protein n=1 Tax=Penicillium lagena TaxID=94218 RepID=UPI002540DFF0|nr:uncharacterized protein N7510_010628 [Penicillium lagena]KAJ5601094.1 hypothetical protein N7510_010628 [Penicillium lagena]
MPYHRAARAWGVVWISWPAFLFLPFPTLLVLVRSSIDTMRNATFLGKGMSLSFCGTRGCGLVMSCRDSLLI